MKHVLKQAIQHHKNGWKVAVWHKTKGKKYTIYRIKEGNWTATLQEVTQNVWTLMNNMERNELS
jgi:hypothetical protein